MIKCNVLYLQNPVWETGMVLIEARTHTLRTLLPECLILCGSRHGVMPNLLAHNLSHSLSPHPHKTLCPLVQYCTVCPHSSVIKQDDTLLEQRDFTPPCWLLLLLGRMAMDDDLERDRGLYSPFHGIITDLPGETMESHDKPLSEYMNSGARKKFRTS